MLTGAGVLIANSSGLGQSEGQPRGLDSDGTYLYALGNAQRRLIKITDLETFASEYASAHCRRVSTRWHSTLGVSTMPTIIIISTVLIHPSTRKQPARH